MDLLNTFLNLVAPPFTFVVLCMFLPPYQLVKFLLSFISSVFTEDVFGKVVLITGASSGIGEFLAYEYARRGACLVLAARREASLREVADLCIEFGAPDAIVVRADVSKVGDCRRMIESTISHYGRLDHLVNNAGVYGIGQLEYIDDVTKIRPVMDTNFWGCVYATRFAIPHLRNTRGKIVVMSSSASWLPMARQGIYNASKAALLTFFETLRVELGSDIKTTIVTPGIIESEFTKGKIVTESGMKVDQELRDVQINVTPIATVEGTAKSIVNGICRGDRYVTVPSWVKMTYLLKALCPELVEWTFRILQMTSLDDAIQGTIGTQMLSFPGARALLYPPGVESPEVKTN